MKIIKCKYCGKEFESDGSKAIANKIIAQHIRKCEFNPNRQKVIDGQKRGSMTMNKKHNEAMHQQKLQDQLTKQPRKFVCIKCGNEYFLDLTDRQYKQILKNPKSHLYRKYCSQSCANKHFLSDEERLKREQLKAQKKEIALQHKRERSFLRKREQQLKQTKVKQKVKKPRVISDETRRKLSEAGKRSAAKMSVLRRSKNEMYFCELCEKEFKNVGHNEPIFNGWDADVLLHDQKVAVLWNGKWHYVEIMKKKNTLKSIQNRDAIKEKEILAANWKLYVIKDMGKYNPKFVEAKFEEFKNYIAEQTSGQKSLLS